MLYQIENGEVIEEVRQFKTFTDDLYQLRDWLSEHECPIVAMESTGVYWRPVYNILENLMNIVLVNARHVRNLPGRKTDIRDCKWLAGLLRHGLVQGSYIPPQKVREWRESTRLRKSLVEIAGDYKRRIQKLFECANIKIDSVVSDLFGVTGRNLIRLLISKSSQLTEADIQKSVRGQLKKKVKELCRAVNGFFKPYHRKILKMLMRLLEEIEKEIEEINTTIKDLMKDHGELLERLDEVPGISEISARGILAELGPTLNDFANADKLSSWCGLCPGNNESAGKRRNGRSPVRNHPLKTLLIEVAWAAVKKKKSYYKEKYYRLKARRGAKRAIVAIAHRLLKAIFHIIKDNARFKDLGEDHFSRRSKKDTLNRLKKQAQQLGYEIVQSRTGELCETAE